MLSSFSFVSEVVAFFDLQAVPWVPLLIPSLFTSSWDILHSHRNGRETERQSIQSNLNYITELLSTNLCVLQRTSNSFDVVQRSATQCFQICGPSSLEIRLVGIRTQRKRHVRMRSALRRLRAIDEDSRIIFYLFLSRCILVRQAFESSFAVNSIMLSIMQFSVTHRCRVQRVTCGHVLEKCGPRTGPQIEWRLREEMGRARWEKKGRLPFFFLSPSKPLLIDSVTGEFFS